MARTSVLHPLDRTVHMLTLFFLQMEGGSTHKTDVVDRVPCLREYVTGRIQP